ncbi:MAG: GntR family transcriptional regulator [Firmicutes bacterium]|nr:GntR family transcriptional regulator [Bacillota bacterium]
MTEQFINFVSIQLSKDKQEALYVQLYDQMRELITTGKLSHGYLLPPVRKFAKFLEINAGTVMSAYKLLEKNGYIFSRTGSGSYVAELSGIVDNEESDKRGEEEIDAIEILSPKFDERYINLASIALNPDLISVEAFKQVLIEVLDRDQGYAFGYQESQGFYPLRESIASDLKKYGVKAEASTMQIISGAQQGIDIVAKAFLNYGDYVFTENPTYPGAIAAFRSRGAKIVEISMEEDGINIEELEDKLRKFRPKLMYVMPNIQNPTGSSYSVAKRNRLMGLARYYNAIILEDDYISELIYGKEMMAPLKAIDRDDRVIYLKSFSKIFMPGLRLAFLMMPQRLVSKLLAIKHNSDISTSGLTQRAFDLYLRKRIWHEHITVIRKMYLERFKLTLAAIEEFLPKTVTYVKPHGGLSIWLTLPLGISAKEIVEEAQNRQVLITEGTPFFPRQAIDRYIRISFATATPAEIQNGIRMIGNVLKSKIISK